MPSCFYCGSSAHQVYGCPTRAVRSVGTLVGKLSKQANADNSFLYSQLEQIAIESRATTEAIRDLTDVLCFEFAAIREQVDTLIGIALHPIAVAARDHYNIGYTCLQRSRLDRRMASEAIRKLQEARQIDPSFYRTYIALGYAYVETHELEIAKDTFHLGMVAAETKLQQAQALLLEGRCSASLGRQEEALSLYSEALSHFAAFAEAHYYSATAIASQGRSCSEDCLSRVKQHLREAIEVYPLFYAKALVDPELLPVRDSANLALRELHDQKRAILRQSHRDLSTAMSDLRKRGADKWIGERFGHIYDQLMSLRDQPPDSYITTVHKTQELERFEKTWQA